MSPLLADIASDALSAVTGSSTIPAVLLVIALVWVVKMLLAEKDARATREKEIAADAKADGQADGKLLADALAKMNEVSISLKELLDHDRDTDEERRANVAEIDAKLDKVLIAVERCTGSRP